MRYSSGTEDIRLFTENSLLYALKERFPCIDVKLQFDDFGRCICFDMDVDSVINNNISSRAITDFINPRGWDIHVKIEVEEGNVVHWYIVRYEERYVMPVKFYLSHFL